MTSKTKTEAPPAFLGVPAAAEELGLSIRTVQNLIATGKIVAVKPNGGMTSSYIITRDELDRVVAERAKRKAAAK